RRPPAPRVSFLASAGLESRAPDAGLVSVPAAIVHLMPSDAASAVTAADLHLPDDAEVWVADADESVGIFLVHDPARGWAACEHRYDGIVHRYSGLDGMALPAYFGEDRTGQRENMLVWVRGVRTACWWPTLPDLLLEPRL